MPAAGLFVFLFGLAVGSFLNVCISRLPEDESVVSPGSRCPQCRTPIRWHDNIPLVSFLALRGKCRHCGARIPWRYFAVELATGLLWFYLWRRFGLSAPFAAGTVLLTILFAVTVTDFETGYIPDKLTFPGMAAGLAVSALWPGLHGEAVRFRGLLDSGLGLLTGGGLLFAVGWLGEKLFRKESMGGGDVKLLAMAGAFLGAQKTVLVFFLAPVLALPFALYMRLFRKAETIPYGPFLALASAAFFLFSRQILDTLVLIYGV